MVVARKTYILSAFRSKLGSDLLSMSFAMHAIRVDSPELIVRTQTVLRLGSITGNDLYDTIHVAGEALVVTLDKGMRFRVGEA